MAHVDAAFAEQVLDIPKRQRKTDIQHHRQADDLWARFEVLEWIFLRHSQTLDRLTARLNPSSFDSTLATEPTENTQIFV